MKNLTGSTQLFALLCILSLSNVYGQTPTVSAQVGYPVGRAAVQVAYGNSKYVLLTNSSYNQVFQSSTGTAWSVATTSGLSGGQLNFIAYGAGLFVVVGNGGVIQTSTDGITWTTQNSGTASNLSKVYFVNSKFFVIGYDRTLLTSADGITWTAVIFNTGSSSDFFMSLAYGNGWYVLAARNNSGGSSAIVYRSTTASDNSWSYAADVPSWNGTNRIQFLKDKFWAFMIGNRMFTSTDGGSWTEITNSVVLTQPDNSTTTWNTSHQIFNGVWDGTKYSFYGSSAYYSGYGSTFTSSDGVNFTLLTKTAYIVPQESTILNGLYFVCGNEGIVSSSDGITYSHSGIGVREMVKTANKYVAVGMISSDGQMYNSTDFSTWTNHSPSNIRELYTVAYNGTGTLLAGGYTGAYASTDEGDSWTKVFDEGNTTFSALAYGNSRFVAGGYDNSSSFLSYSTDGGSTWTIASTLNYWYTKIKYVNGKFFALGSSNDDYLGRIMYSDDGISWSDVTPSLGFDTYYYKDVAFDGTKYHFLGIDANESFFTISTATPSTASSYGSVATCSNTPAGVTLGGAWDEGLLDYSAGKFTGAVIDVATGQDYIITSTNASSWTALPQNSYSTITGSYLNGQTVQLIGRSNAFFTVSYSGILPVSLFQFAGTPSGSSVLLNWITASEKNTRQFVIEHSADGRSWKPLGSVNAVGAMTNNYSFTHSTPVVGTNFYRLLIQDIDGAKSYSNIVTVYFDKQLQSRLYPNPVSSQLTIRSSDPQPVIVLIFNAAGQPVKRMLTSGYETKLNVSFLAAGIYIGEIKQGGRIQKFSFLKN
jgi:hypothetical protein